MSDEKKFLEPKASNICKTTGGDVVAGISMVEVEKKEVFHYGDLELKATFFKDEKTGERGFFVTGPNGRQYVTKSIEIDGVKYIAEPAVEWKSFERRGIGKDFQVKAESGEWLSKDEYLTRLIAGVDQSSNSGASVPQLEMKSEKYAERTEEQVVAEITEIFKKVEEVAGNELGMLLSRAFILIVGIHEETLAKYRVQFARALGWDIRRLYKWSEAYSRLSGIDGPVTPGNDLARRKHAGNTR